MAVSFMLDYMLVKSVEKPCKNTTDGLVFLRVYQYASEGKFKTDAVSLRLLESGLSSKCSQSLTPTLL